MTRPARADVELLEKLLLGHLPVEEVERLAIEYADDSQLAELAEALAGRDDTLLDSLRNQQPSTDPNVDHLVNRLVQRLRGAVGHGISSSDTIGVSKDGPFEHHPLPERLEYFRIQKVLGEGGMGTVYLADDTRLGRQVALKTLRRDLAVKPAARDRFLREARSAARLDHDHIIPIYYVGEADGTPFLAMPLLQGEPLDCRLKREKADDKDTPLPIPEAIRIARQMALGLSAAHSQGLIHRDIKPGNIWLEAPSGRVKILDFGLARIQGDDTRLTDSGAIVGTPAYMSPEQARSLPIDQRGDLFSLGCVLYEMVTGKRPFSGTDTLSILSSLALDTPEAPHEINPLCPPALSGLTMQLLAKEPDQRPASAKVIVDALTKMETPMSTATAVCRADIDVSNDTVSVFGPLRKGLSIRAESRPSHTLLAIAAVLLALVPLGWWLASIVLRVETDTGTLVVEINGDEVEARIKKGKLILTGPDGKDRYTLAPSERNKKIDAGPYRIRVEGADGLTLDTPEFTLKKGGEVTVRVTVASKAANLDADRKAAEFVLSIGGTVRVNDEPVRDIKAVADLPREAFRLTVFNLTNNKKVNDAALVHFKDCKNLTSLGLDGTQVGDVGLAHFKDCKNLWGLWLQNTQVSDAGLAYFKDCKKLSGLLLNNTQTSDEGLAHLKDCKNLVQLGLSSTQVSDAGLAHLKDCKKLKWIYLAATEVSDVGLAAFKDCKNLEELDLDDTNVGDAGVSLFKDCKNLSQLYLRKTKVTAAKIEELKKALPKCKIEWDGGTIPAK